MINKLSYIFYWYFELVNIIKILTDWAIKISLITANKLPVYINLTIHNKNNNFFKKC